ncbi:glycosyltransferase family 31 protein [Polychaeton citri CBS 116435]|uniref:N-acetylgalactosaminide beta-1,3-galactosyltransferase n=1 Tax=Polychaeton citri CBS 116435 TaxID=1314669 RepID=A0A9P4Q9V0_9PEZI|nr:glycosyltransferase family 31 protein [Polychaeton citri CBS 116435]
MLLPTSSTSRRLPLVLIGSVSFILFIAILTLLSTSAPLSKLDGWIVSSTKKEGIPEPVAEVIPEFYQWNTRSAFRPVRQDHVDTKTVEELCASFPTHLLEHVQPVLKTGHGSVSACLSNLIIVSDVDEEFMDHDIIDLTVGNDQLPAYWTQREMAENGTLAGADLSRLDGWKLDKFKFLPQISRAWRTSPNMRWYIFYEADTYIVWDNVFRLLENFDPDIPWYFGSPSPGRAGTWFANGGPGYIMSREAVRRLVKDDWSAQGEYLGSKLTETMWDDLIHDCCGDSIVGWALYNRGVNISGLWPMFNTHPLHGVPFSDLYWCQPVLTMHKPYAEDMMGLWRWSESRREIQRPLLYRDLVEYTGVLDKRTRDNWDNAAWDGFRAPADQDGIDPHSSFDACGHACEKHPDCLQWGYHLRECTFVHSIRLGNPLEPKIDDSRIEEFKEKSMTEKDKRFMAGYAIEKARRWIAERPCDEVQWVRPSIKRIF